MRSLRGAGVSIRKGEQYPKRKVAEKEAEKITRTGSAVDTSMPMWIAPPHFYKSGRFNRAVP